MWIFVFIWLYAYWNYNTWYFFLFGAVNLCCPVSAAEEVGYLGDLTNKCDRLGTDIGDYSENEGATFLLNIPLEEQLQSKLHYCSYCPYSTRHKSDMTKHLRKHTGEKPFACNLCSRTFSLRCNLKTHLQVHSKLKAFKCEHCNKTFSQKHHLTRHMLLHFKIGLFQCAMCNSKFSRKDHLLNHLRMHEN